MAEVDNPEAILTFEDGTNIELPLLQSGEFSADQSNQTLETYKGRKEKVGSRTTSVTFKCGIDNGDGALFLEIFNRLDRGGTNYQEGFAVNFSDYAGLSWAISDCSCGAISPSSSAGNFTTFDVVIKYTKATPSVETS
jgi:hypothetical protein